MIFPYAIPSLRDNYIWLLSTQEQSSKDVIIIDPGDDKPVVAHLSKHRLVPTAIIITHRHYDHVDGIMALKQHYNIPVYGPAGSTIPGLTHPLGDQDMISFGSHLTLQVIATPGHTLDHISYYTEGMLFCGDTLFAAGCGRLFDGTVEQLFQSLSWINTLPEDTRIYCSHEYTLANLQFAMHVEPYNQVMQERLQHCQQLRQQGQITLPTTLTEERRTNPFLRCTEPTVIAAVSQFAGRELNTPAEVFNVLRFWKDTY